MSRLGMAGARSFRLRNSRLVTEQGNPGDLANIVRAIVEVPSPRLQRGILLIETPGLGSLAKRSATETLAYLLSADLALLLIGAGTTLSEEDLGTLRLLYGVGIPALGLLSKADLLASKDLDAYRPSDSDFITAALRKHTQCHMAVRAEACRTTASERSRTSEKLKCNKHG
jgi:hypothetical protein